MLSRLKDFGEAVAASITSFSSLPASFAYLPDMYTIPDGGGVIVSPASHTMTPESRGVWRESFSVQAVILAVVTSANNEDVDAYSEIAESIKDAFLGGFIETGSESYRVESVISSGTTVLSSSQIEGGVIDSKILGESCIVQIPVIIEADRFIEES